jgi:hypothetical protein
LVGGFFGFARRGAAGRASGSVSPTMSILKSKG